MAKNCASRWLVSILLALSACQADTGSGVSRQEDLSGQLGADQEIELESTAAALSVTADPTIDTVLRSGAPYANDGAGSTLGVTSVSVADIKRSIVKMALPAIPAGNVLYSARLEMKVVGLSAGWLGGGIDLLRMNRDWQENGATWVCANDTNSSILLNSCTSANNWSMQPGGSSPQPFVTAATDRQPVFTGGLTTISFDVTQDVQAFLNNEAVNHGWMLAGFNTPLGGEWVNFGSRQGPAASRPQLIVEYGPDQCPSNPRKGIRGVCGCDKPDLDTNYDEVVDCFGAVVNATADTALRALVPYGNDGQGVFLGATSLSVVGLERSLIKVDNTAINAARNGQDVTKAYLELTIAGIAVGWSGGALDLNRMIRNWVEGNPPGRGATWVCADDTDTTSLFGRNNNNCSGANAWGMQIFDLAPFPFDVTPSARAGLVWPGMRTVRFDVTADVKGFLANPASNFGWIVQGGASNFLSGSLVDFGSRESGAPPHLLLELAPACPPGVSKSAPGVCGCFQADTDTDGDGTANCIDACPTNPSKTRTGVCGCDEPETDSDGDCLPNCIDPCPADNDPAAGGQCGCPSSPKAQGIACGDSATGDFAVCDGAGHCGSASTGSPQPSCACRLINAPEKNYWFCPCARTRAQADTACRATPGQELVQIDDAAENDLIAGCVNASVWTGANDVTTEGAWLWNTQEANEDPGFWDGAATGKRHLNRYANWRTNEPQATPDCGAMDSRAAGGKWYANNCSTNLGFVCESDSSDIVPPAKTTDTCMLLGYPCATDTPAACVSDATAFGSMDTQAEWQAAYNACAAAGGNNCPPPLDSASTAGKTCASLAPTLNAAGPGVVCPLNLASSVNVNALTLCSDPDVAAECPAGQQCGYASRCDNCTGASCPPCTGDDQCGTGRCSTFLACGTPVCQYYCENQPNTGTQSCRFDADCGSGVQCGWTKECALPNGAGVHTSCTRDTDCPAVGGQPNACAARKACGTPVPGCFRNYNATGETGCSETVLCGNIVLEPQTAVLELQPTAAQVLSSADFPAAQVPPVAQFAEQPPCPSGSSCATGPTPVQGVNHPYCNFDVPDASQLLPRKSPDSLSLGKTSRAGSGKLKFEVAPNLALDYGLKAGPLGLVYPKAGAKASFGAKAIIDNILNLGYREIPVVDVLAQLSAGLRPDEELCGISPGDSHVRLFGINLLPADFLDDLRLPKQEQAKKCIKAVKKFQDLADRAKKAFFDAQALLKEYNRRLKEDPLNPKTFPGPTIANPNIPSLCEVLVKDPAPVGFPPANPNCKNELPEETINRFIRYYNKQLQTLVDEGVGNVADQIDGALAGAISTKSNTADGHGWSIPLANLHDLEEVTLFNQTFLVGPIPVLLQGMFTVEYGFQLNAEIGLRIGDALKQALAYRSEGSSTAIVNAGLSGAPYAQAGLGLFVGVGFDIGIAAASVGIQGNLTLGRLAIPVHAGAGIFMDTIDDERTLTMPLPPYLKGLADSGNLSPLQLSFPVRKFGFDLRFVYGADLQLSKLLQGSIDLRVRVKLLFFSKTWRKNIVRFNGLAPINFKLFSGGSAAKRAKWGTVEMPMPFFQLQEIKLPDFVAVKDNMEDALAKLYPHEQFLFDAQCDCVRTFESVPPAEQAELRACGRKSDCCDKGNANITCFNDPANAGAGKCTTCRALGTWGSGPSTRAPGASCNDDDDCCPGSAGSFCLPVNSARSVFGPSINTGICMPKSGCLNLGYCDDISDCAAGLECTVAVHQCDGQACTPI